MLKLLSSALTLAPDYPTYTENYITQPLDHANPALGSYQMRYLTNSDQWDGRGKLENGCKGPILFYTGNEGGIDAFWRVTGFVVNDLAKKWGAMVVFGEHRYYGKSLPFGNESLTPENAVYLKTEHALDDFASLLKDFKIKNNATNCPVVSFGGSYGGTLTTFFRVKYPNVTVGGLAASAPVGYYDPQHWSEQGVTPYTWIDIVDKDYTDAGCFDKVTAVTKLIESMSQTPAGTNTLLKYLQPCNDKVSSDYLTYMWTDVIETLPQMDYSYAIGAVPASPVNASCSQLNKASIGDTEGLLKAAREIMSWYYPVKNNCLDIPFSAPPQGGIPGGGPPTLFNEQFIMNDPWGYQSCTETLHCFSGRGVRNYTFNLQQQNEICQKFWKTQPQTNHLAKTFGGYAINSAESAVTNVIWSNGLRDPWHGGGFLKQTKESCPVIIIPSGAHHGDLRQINPADPPDLVAARAQEEKIMWKWITDASQPGM